MWLMNSATATAIGTAIDDRDRGRHERAEGERPDVLDQALAAGDVRASAVIAGQALTIRKRATPASVAG